MQRCGIMDLRVPVVNAMNNILSSCRALWSSAVSSLLDLLFPPRCPICERILLKEEPFICARCARELPFVREPFCMRCGKPVSNHEKELCADCETHNHLFDEGRAVFLYEKGVRLSVNRLKFYNHREYIPFYGECLLGLYLEMAPLWKAQCLVPIPMHPRKRAIRGFDQAQLLAGYLSMRCNLPVLDNLLIRSRFTKSSKKLGRSDRRKNLRGVFRIHDGADIPESVILIDDIFTTGATMDEASLALREAGVRRIYFLTVCIGRGDT